jgi:D-aspartate ligase
MKKTKVYQSNMPVGVVFDCHVNGLGVMRSLGEKGVPVLGLDCNPRNMGLLSKYCHGEVCPDPSKNERAFVDSLCETGRKLKNKGVLFPTNDVWLIAVSRHQKELESYFLFPMSGWEVIRNCVDKARMYQIASEADIPIPETLFCREVAELKNIRPRIKYPCIIKARVTTEFDQTFKSRFVRIEREAALDDWLQQNEAALSRLKIGFVVQEIIPGGAASLYTFSAYSNAEAEVVAFSTIRKTRQYPPDYGTITSGEVIRQPEVIESGTRLIKKLNYYGLSNIEFKRDERDGRFRLMEINARSGKSIYYTTSSGLNLPYFAYQEATGVKLGPRHREGEYGRGWMVFLDDLATFLHHPGQENRSQGSTPWRNLRNWCFGGRMIEAVCSWRDPLPGIAFGWNYLLATFRFLGRKIGRVLSRGEPKQ